ncbi:MAG: glucose 1-dehydrogenase [Planctomycetes bacterium]|nr:glucose 1-dehydrogenase [Planctomycetota bacterium]
MGRLSERITLVTGAGSGIGRAIAERFGAEGAFVQVTDISEAAARDVAARIRSAGGAADGCTLDVRDSARCAEVAAAVHAAHGRLDVLVNNAGVGHVGTALTTELEDLDRLHAVNVRGLLAVTKAFLPHMVERRSGNIVNLASIGGVVGVRERLAYCATKFAVVGITKSMALDHALQGIRVNCICPGRVETPFVTARLAEYPDPEAAYREMSATQALGRMGRPEEIAEAALYLASDASAFVTGTTFMIDGGWSAGK